jgi:hypothetical protein
MLCTIFACVPKEKQTLPYVEGKVIDGVTNKALDNVTIISESGEKTFTSESGIFKLKGSSSITIATPMGGIYKIENYFKVIKENYGEMNCMCEVLNTEKGCYDIEIPLFKEDIMNTYGDRGVSCIYIPKKILKK